MKKAQELLKASGYDGTPVVLMKPTDLAAIQKLPDVAAQLLRQAGFKVDLQAMDWQTLVGRRAKKDPPDKGGWHMFLTAWQRVRRLEPDRQPDDGHARREVGLVRLGQGRQDRWSCATSSCARPTSRRRRSSPRQIQARAFEVATHAPLGEYDQPMAARKNISGFFIDQRQHLLEPEEELSALTRDRARAGSSGPSSMLSFLARRAAGDVAGAADRRGAGVPDAAADAGRPGGGARRRRRDHRADRAASAPSLGLDRSIPEQFAHLVRRACSPATSASRSTTRRRSPTLIGQRLEPTLSLAALTIVIAVLVAVPLGVLAAWRFGGWLDRALMGFSVLGFSMPVFVLAYLLIWLVSLQARLAAGAGLPARSPTASGRGCSTCILPAITLSVIYIALIARVTRASVLEALGEDYIRTARAKGLPEMPRAGAPCARQRRGADRHRDRHRHRAADRRRGRHRVGLRDPRPRPAHGRRGAGARLPDHPGRDPAVLVRLRADQPAGRPVATCSSIRGSATEHERAVGHRDRAVPRLDARADRRGRQQPAPGRACARSWSVRIGGSCWSLLVAIALAGAVARHGRPVAVRPGEPRPAARASGRDHDARRRDARSTAS